MVTQAQEYLNSLFHNSTEEIEVVNPLTGEVFARVPNTNREMVATVVERGRIAQKTWGAVSVKDRCRIMRRFADLLIDQQDSLIRVIRRETGKAHSSAFGEVAALSIGADFYAKYASRWLKPEKVRGLFPFMYDARIYRKPLGVVGNISPWNYPFFLSLVDMLPALLAGNAVVVKPSEITPFSAMEGMGLLRAAGLPEHLMQVVTGYGETGAALIDQVDFIMFTGSTSTGRKIALQAAERMIPFSLEMGGNDPLIVLRDADINRAAAAAVRGGYENAGQFCMSVERIIVEASIYDEFLETLKTWHTKLVVGKDSGFDVHMGSLTNIRELERTEDHILDAVEKGAKVIAGGKRMAHLGPLFFEPTILAGVKPTMRLWKEETFGPLISILKVRDADEAVKVANDSPYGLSASVWSRHRHKALDVARRLESGDVHINAVINNIGMFGLEAGGVKDSGFGRRNGKQGLLKYTVSQSISIERIALPPEPTLYTAKLRTLFEVMRKIQRWLPLLGQ